MIYEVNGRLRFMMKGIDVKKILLDNILTVMSRRTFSKSEADRIVGGKGKLTELIVCGKVRMEKPSDAQNGKWQCNAGDVLMHCRDARKL